MDEKEKDSKNVAEMLEGGEPAPVNPQEGQEAQAETARSKALSRLRERNSERNFKDDDDDAVFGAINDDYDADQAELEGYRGDAKRWNDFLGSDDKAASFVNDWQESGSPIFALVEEYGEDVMSDLTNPENMDKIKERETKRLERLAKDKELDEEYNKNINESRERVQGMKDAGSYSAEQIDAAIDSLIDKQMKIITGYFDEKMIEDEIKTMNYEGDVKKAGEQGEVRGRNKNIQREFGRRRNASDGVPALPNGGGGSNAAKPNGYDKASRRGNMWGD